MREKHRTMADKPADKPYHSLLWRCCKLIGDFERPVWPFGSLEFPVFFGMHTRYDSAGADGVQDKWLLRRT
jgi:hypothetical protein